MIEQTKKLRLEDIKVESFVTRTTLNSETIKGGSFDLSCIFPLQCAGDGSDRPECWASERGIDCAGTMSFCD